MDWIIKLEKWSDAQKMNTHTNRRPNARMHTHTHTHTHTNTNRRTHAHAHTHARTTRHAQTYLPLVVCGDLLCLKAFLKFWFRSPIMLPEQFTSVSLTRLSVLSHNPLFIFQKDKTSLEPRPESLKVCIM